MNKPYKLLLFVWFLSHSHGAPQNNPLQKATSELSTISRLVNGIAIQHEINSKTLKMDEFVSEILNVDPRINGLSTLQKTDLSDVVEKMTKVSEEAKAVKTSSLDSAAIENKLKTLGDLGGNLDSLQKSNRTQLEELKETVNLATQSESEKSFFKFSPFIIIAGVLNITNDEAEAPALVTAFGDFKKHYDEFDGTRKSIKNFEENLKNLWAIRNVPDVVEYLEALGQVTDQLNKNYADFSSLSNDLEGLKSEFSAVEKGLINIVEMKQVAGLLNSTLEVYESMKSNPLQTLRLTPGFPSGTKDMKLMFKEVKEDWLKLILTHNNESGWKTLIKELDGFRILIEKSEAVSSSWKSLENVTNPKELAETTNVWNEISATSLNSAEVKNLQNSTSQIRDCLNLLHPIPQGFDFDSFKTVSEKVKALAALATKSHELFGQLASIEILQNDALFDSLNDKIRQTTNKHSVVINTMESIQRNESYRELIKGVLDAASIIEEIGKEKASKVLDFKGIDLDLMIKGHDEFEKTQLIQSLRCLKNEKFDSSKISETLKFGSDLRALGSHSTKDKTTVPFLNQMIHFKKHYVEVIGSKGTSSRTTRSVSYSSSLDKPLSVSKDLAKGVELIQNLADLQENEQLMNEVAKSKKEVLDEMKRVLPSIDTSSFTNGLLKMVQDLKSLVSRVSSEETLEKYEKLFGVASGISGVPINSTLLIDPVSTALSASNRTSESDSFRKLGGFELDYSSHQKELNTASLTVTKLKQYFDGLFSHPKEGNENKSPTSWWAIVGYTLLAIGVIGGIPTAVYFVYRYRQKQKLKKEMKEKEKKEKAEYERKLKDPNSWLYLFFPEERNRVGKSYWNDANNRYLPLQQAIVSDNWDTFKQLVDSGANVNAYCQWDSPKRGARFTSTLQLAACNAEPKYAEYLIENGARLDLLDSDYRRVTDYEVEKGKVSYPALEGKTFSRRLPPQLKTEEFKIQILGTISQGYKVFQKKFQNQIVMNFGDATHLVFPGTNGRTFTLWEETRYFLPYFFCGKMIMSETWLADNNKEEKPGKNGEKPKLILDYDKHRVTTIRYHDVEYKTVFKMYEHVQQRQLPFLGKIKAYFFGGSSGDWEPLAAAVNLLGGIAMNFDVLPNNNDPIWSGEPHEYKHIYSPNEGPIYIFTENPGGAKDEAPWLNTPNDWVVFMNYAMAMKFLLQFNIPNLPPKNIKSRSERYSMRRQEEGAREDVQLEWLLDRFN